MSKTGLLFIWRLESTQNLYNKKSTMWPVVQETISISPIGTNAHMIKPKITSRF